MLLDKLESQITHDEFTYSVCVVDNDFMRSAEGVILQTRRSVSYQLAYFVEEIQNIALARNKAVENATGDYIAFIDDDELPADDWLHLILKTAKQLNAACVIGPVLPIFESKPEPWIERGKFYVKCISCTRQGTGEILKFESTYTANAFVERRIFNSMDEKFLPQFGSGGEDRDFFKRAMEKGHKIFYCEKAMVYEVIPDERVKRKFMIKRALLRGQVAQANSENGLHGLVDVLKSAAAILLYTPALLLLQIGGHHLFIKFLIKDFDHIGKILAYAGVKIIKEKYLITN